MKKITKFSKHLFLFFAFVSLSAHVWAATPVYNGGTWYSLYDNTTHTMNTQGDYSTNNVCAPTAGTFNVKWKYEWVDLVGFAKKIDTEVQESSNDGGSVNTLGKLQEKTKNKSDVTEKFNVSTDINWVKFNRQGAPTHKVHVYYMDIPMAKHLRLAGGDYGLTSDEAVIANTAFGSTSAAYHINLRSFLSESTQIRYVSNNPEFHFGNGATTKTFIVMANACAYAGGSANCESTNTQVGNPDNQEVDVYFTPSANKNATCTATISIYDGSVERATITFTAQSLLTYTVVFHGNGNTGGEMENELMVYSVAKNLNSNGFERAYTVTYDAAGGNCDQESAVASYDFAGWAKSADGEVVYSDAESVSNLSAIPGAVVDLYAKWKSKSVVLPAVEKAGNVLEGWYEGETRIGRAGAEYIPVSDVTLRANLADKFTPDFVLAANKIALGASTTLELHNTDGAQVAIAPENIVEYDAESGAIKGIAVGTVTITVTQPGTEYVNEKQQVFELAVKNVPTLNVLLNNTSTTSIAIEQGQGIPVSFTKESNAEVQLNQIDGAAYVTYSEGMLTASFGIGTAHFSAVLAETETYFGTSFDFSVTVKKSENRVPVTNNTGYSLGDATWGGFSWGDKTSILHFEGIPDKLSFDYKYSSNSATQNDGKTHMYVEESADNNTWRTIWENSQPSENTVSSGNVQLSKTTRYVKFHYRGNFAADFTNIKVTECKYVDNPDPSNVDLGVASINSGEVKGSVFVNWCNIAPMNVTSSNPRFSVSPSSFGEYDLYNSQEITIKYTHTSEPGLNEGIITISNGVAEYDKVIYVKAETTLRPQTIEWNKDLAATGFAMNVGEQYPDENISVIAITENGEQITYSSDNSDVIEVVDNTILVAKSVGTANITAYQAGDKDYAATEDTKLFTVSELLKQTISWEQNLYGLLTTDGSVELTATATSGGEITYESADEHVVKIIDGNMLLIVGEGETTITAHQSGGVIDEHEYLPVSAENYVIVRDPASQCKGQALTVGTLTLNSSRTSKEYNLVGTPTTLTFTALHGTKSSSFIGFDPVYSALIVEEYRNSNGQWGWHELYNAVVGTSPTASGTITMDATATKIRFSTLETGTSHTISNIQIGRAKYLRTETQKIDEEAERNAIWSRKITVSHSNIDLMTISTKNGLLSLSQNTLGEGCGDFGDDVFTVSFTPQEKDVEYKDTIVISDGKAEPSTIEIPVRLVTTSLNQSITGFELQEKCVATDVVEIPAATATSGLEVIYLSSDSTVAYVEEGKLKIFSSGTVEITAYQAGNDRYNPASLTKAIEIVKAAAEIEDAPVAGDLTYGQTLNESELSGGKGRVDGHFEWEDATIAPDAGTRNYNVKFIPENTAIYASSVVAVEVNIAKVAAVIDIAPAGDTIKYDGAEHVLIKAGSVTGGEFQYSTDGENYSANLPKAVNQGEYTIWYKVVGDANHTDIEPASVQTLISGRLKQMIYWEFGSGYVEGDVIDLKDYDDESISILIAAKDEFNNDLGSDIELVSSDSAIAYAEKVFDGMYAFSPLSVGTVVITAVRDGDETYLPVASSKTFVIIDSRIVDPSTGCEEVEAGAKAVKIIRDGQLFIIRGDKTYTPSGLLVK